MDEKNEKNCPISESAHHKLDEVLTTTADLSVEAPSSAQLSIDVENVSTSNQDNIVDWDGPQDPQNPQNWSSAKKWTIIILISAITFNQYASHSHIRNAVCWLTHV